MAKAVGRDQIMFGDSGQSFLIFTGKIKSVKRSEKSMSNRETEIVLRESVLPPAT